MATITEIRVNINKNQTSKVKAWADITLDASIKLDGIRIVEGRNGLFIGFPEIPLKSPYTNRDGQLIERKGIYYPITKECREVIQNHVLSAYQRELSKISPTTSPSTGGFGTPPRAPYATPYREPYAAPAPQPVYTQFVEEPPFDVGPQPIVPTQPITHTGNTPRVNIPNVNIG